MMTSPTSTDERSSDFDPVITGRATVLESEIQQTNSHPPITVSDGHWHPTNPPPPFSPLPNTTPLTSPSNSHLVGDCLDHHHAALLGRLDKHATHLGPAQRQFTLGVADR